MNKKIVINIGLMILYVFIAVLLYHYEQLNVSIVKAIQVLLVILFNVSLIKLVEESIDKKVRDPEKIFVMNSVIEAAAWIIAILMIISIIFGSWKSLLTVIGLMGAGLTVALQQPILNLLGWAILLSGRFYVVGDRIEIENIKGDVYEITAMYTKLRRLTMNDEPTGSSITIPNHYILTKPIINYSKPSRYVWDRIRISITYESSIEKARQIMMDALRKIIDYEEESKRAVKRKRIKFEDMHTDPKIRIELKDSSIDLILRYLVDIRRKNDIHVKILREIINKVNKSRTVSFAYPHVQIVR